MDAEWIKWLAGILFPLLLGSSFLAWLGERKKNKATGVIAARTVELEVASVDTRVEKERLGLLEDRLDLIDEATRQERDSWIRTIGNLRGDLEHALNKLGDMETQLIDSNRQKRIAIGYIRILLAYISSRVTDPADAPPIPDGLDINT